MTVAGTYYARRLDEPIRGIVTIDEPKPGPRGDAPALEFCPRCKRVVSSLYRVTSCQGCGHVGVRGES